MEGQPQSSQDIKTQIDLLRRKLLDLSLRNRMLNYRHSRRLSITVVGEDSCEVFRLLTEDPRKKLTFVGKLDPPQFLPDEEKGSNLRDTVALEQFRREAEDELDAFLGNAVKPVDQLDTKLSSDDYEAALQIKLRVIHREALLANDELGINTLFLALGSLNWTDNDQKKYYAPLLFIPVQLERQGNGVMKLVHEGSDVGDNLPLRAKLSEFNIKLPVYNEEEPLEVYFSEVATTIKNRSDWSVNPNDIVLGFFSYEKFAMYMDLGGDLWPEGQKPWDSTELVALLSGSYPAIESDIDEDSFLDDLRPLNECSEVFDADSSQTLAIMRAIDGHSLVVEGPPGTGKSQTITNMIAEAVSRGKRVLFVSEKKAALDVVKRKFDEAGLGEMCLDLHDKTRNRKEFYAEIKRTASLSVKLKTEEAKVDRLGKLRDHLNAYAASVNDPLVSYDTTPFAAMSALAKLPQEKDDDIEGRVSFESLRRFKAIEIETATPLVTALQERLAAVGVPMVHPYWGIDLEFLDPSLRLDLQASLKSAIVAYQSATTKIQNAAEAFKIPAPDSASQIALLKECVRMAAEAPELDGISIRSTTWERDATEIEAVISALITRNQVLADRSRQVVDAMWTADVQATLQAYEAYAEKWFRLFVGEYRTAKRTVKALLVTETSGRAVDVRDLLRDIARYQAAERDIHQRTELMEQLFGSQWKGFETDPKTILTVLKWSLDIHRRIHAGELPAGLLDFFTTDFEDATLSDLVKEAELHLQAAMTAYQGASQLLKYPVQGCERESWHALGERLEGWLNHLDRLPAYLAYLESRRAVIKADLASVVEVADRWSEAVVRLVDSYKRSYYAGVMREAIQERPELRTFDRLVHEAAISEFQELDDFKLSYNRACVRVSHYRNLPDFASAVGNLQLLRLQCELKTRHRPIRWIMERAGAAIQRIKPVFMMSPLTVAIHLPPEMPPFDLVIFDEASQVKPEDALCAIIRAKQTIVVGDTRQLPPTSFFDRVSDDDDSDDEQEATEATLLGQEARKLESILSLMSAVAMGRARRPDLRWHYRSVHPALIQPSNEMFYGNRLVVFPSPSTEQNGQRIGVVFHHNPSSIYEPGASRRVNRLEAEEVAKAVLRHLLESPQLSLMVAAMNRNQADLIDDEIAKLRSGNEVLFQKFESVHPHERLIVRNLENVQGDERDVVFISVTYGRDANGTIREQFGPLLQDGGERRLNVLITRARRRCEVFSNLKSEDIRNVNQRPSLRDFQMYLRFAEKGDLDLSTPTGLDAESPFEEEVIEILRSRGYEVDPQVGAAGYRIDMAVRDPKAPGRFVLGIECDGAAYHSARSARDRDKLRQRVLEARGWSLHRIWSSNWWQDRDGEISRLLKAIEEACSGDEEEPEPAVQGNGHVSEVLIEERLVEDLEVRKAPPYRATTPPSDLQNENELRAYLLQVVQTEGPIGHDLLFNRLKAAARHNRVTQNVRLWLNRLIQDACDNNKVRLMEGAYHVAPEQLYMCRDWSGRPASERKTDYVTTVELATALKRVVKASFGVSQEDAVKAAFAHMGFKRVTQEANERGAIVVKRLVASGGLMLKDGLLTIP